MFNSTLFVSGSIHQGDERFSESSRGRQCSFMSFSALLYSQMHPVEFWGSHTVNEILKYGDTLYLQALRNQTIPDTETLSLDYLPDRARWFTVQSPVEAHNSNEMPSEAHNSNENMPIIEAHNLNEMPIEAHSSNEMPVEAHNSNENMPIEAHNLNENMPIEAHNSENAFLGVSKDVQSKRLGKKVKTSNNPLWLINYNEFYQGQIGMEDTEAPYFTLHSALMNAFSVSNYVFIILDPYTMALIKSADDIFMFDSHARNCFGMPDSNGSTVVMKCTDIKNLEQYLHQLSFELACEMFEIVPVEFYPDKNFSPTKTKSCNETDLQKCRRLQKAKEYKKQKILL